MSHKHRAGTVCECGLDMDDEIARLCAEVEDRERAIKDVEEERNKACAEVERLTLERNQALGEASDATTKLAQRDYMEWRKAYDSELGQRFVALSEQLKKAKAVVRAAEEWGKAIMTSNVCVLGYSTCPGGDHRHLSKEEEVAMLKLAGLVQRAAYRERA